jgi:membrane-associated protein
VLDTLRDLFQKYRDLEVLVRLVGYPGLIGIVFAETGLLVGFFLPGDSLLFTSGFLASLGVMDVRILLVTLSIAAVLGDQVGFLIGRKAGEALYRREDSRFFKRKHLIAAHEFYERYGGKTIFLARFVPIIRTFAPTVAGAARMDYRKFVLFNVAGGISWVFSMVGGGYLLGQTFPGLKKHIELVVLGVIFVSVLPIVWEMWKARREKAARPEPDGSTEG